MEGWQEREQVHRPRQEEGEGRRKEEIVTYEMGGSPRGSQRAALVKAPGDYERQCMHGANSEIVSDGVGQEFNRPGKMATLHEGEPLDPMIINSPGRVAESRREETTPGECQELEDSTIAAIFTRAVEVLRKDGQQHSRRSNTELDHGPQCPPFPLRIRTEGWGARLGFPHLPKYDMLVTGTMAALNHLAGFEGSLEPLPDEAASSTLSPETSVRSLAEKRLAALVVRNRMWEVP